MSLICTIDIVVVWWCVANVADPGKYYTVGWVWNYYNYLCQMSIPLISSFYQTGAQDVVGRSWCRNTRLAARRDHLKNWTRISIYSMYVSHKYTNLSIYCKVSICMHRHNQGLASIQVLGIGASIIKIRRSHDRLIFIMGIPILITRHLYIETGPRFRSLKQGTGINKSNTHIAQGNGLTYLPRGIASHVSPVWNYPGKRIIPYDIKAFLEYWSFKYLA